MGAGRLPVPLGNACCQAAVSSYLALLTAYSRSDEEAHAPEG